MGEFIEGLKASVKYGLLGVGAIKASAVVGDIATRGEITRATNQVEAAKNTFVHTGLLDMKPIDVSMFPTIPDNTGTTEVAGLLNHIADNGVEVQQLDQAANVFGNMLHMVGNAASYVDSQVDALNMVGEQHLGLPVGTVLWMSIAGLGIGEYLLRRSFRSR